MSKSVRTCMDYLVLCVQFCFVTCELEAHQLTTPCLQLAFSRKEKKNRPAFLGMDQRDEPDGSEREQTNVYRRSWYCLAHF
jgi:hypothetical protein